MLTHKPTEFKTMEQLFGCRKIHSIIVKDWPICSPNSTRSLRSNAFSELCSHEHVTKGHTASPSLKVPSLPHGAVVRQTGASLKKHFEQTVKIKVITYISKALLSVDSYYSFKLNS